MGRVGIGNAEPGQDLGLQALHDLGLDLACVIVAQEVQHAVHHQVGEVVAERLVLGPRLGPSGLEGDGDVAEVSARRPRAARAAGSAAGKDSTLVASSRFR